MLTPRERTTAKRRALKLWRTAPPEILRAGEHWYPHVAGVACGLAPQYDRRTVLSALAVLSPRVSVSQNLRDLDAVVNHPDWIVAAFPRNVDRARRILAGEGFDAVMGPAPKVRAFRANLLGDTDAVTVDTWMRRVLTGTGHQENAPTLTLWQYRQLAEILRECAAQVGTDPRTFQSVVWIAARKRVM